MHANGPPETEDTLWMLIVGPIIWAVHFLLCYITAAIWCAKVVAPVGSLGGARTAVGVYTVLALVGIGISIVKAYRQHTFGEATLPHDYDTAADRHRFIGYATLLLSSLSFVATAYVGAVAWFIGDCA